MRLRHSARPGFFLGFAFLFCLAVCLGQTRPASAVGDLDSDKIVLEAGNIAKLKVRTVTELLNLIPGVKAGESSVSIRGSYKVRVLLDGMALNDPGSTTVRLDMVPFRGIKRVEVFKGGGGVAHGDDSSGGVVLFTTQALDKATAFTEVAGGNHNAIQSRLGVTASQGAWGAGLGGEYKESDGYRLNGDKESKRAGFKLSYNPESWGPGRAPTLALDMSEQRAGNAGYPEYPTPRSRTNDEALGSSLNWERWGLSSGTYFTRFQSESMNPDKAQHSLLRTWSLKQDLRRPLPVWDMKDLTAGASAEIIEGQGSELATRQEQSMALFLSKKTVLEPWGLCLTTGLRGSLYSDFENVLNPEIEISRDLGRHRIKAAVTRSNNLPTFRQRYFRHSTLAPNPGLGMERATNFSLGLSSDWHAGLSGDLAFFHRQVEDSITYVLGEGGVGQYRNLGKTVMTGLDASLKWRVKPWLELKPSYTYMVAKDQDTGLHLVAKPEHKLSLDILLHPGRSWTLGLLYSFESRQFTRTDNSQTTDPIHKLDLRCEYRLGAYRLFATVENLCDVDYLYGDGYPAPPRTWLVGLGREF